MDNKIPKEDLLINFDQILLLHCQTLFKYFNFSKENFIGNIKICYERKIYMNYNAWLKRN